ncbi:MAG: hypothetical protein DME57_09420 [Verrucomicrobia bacterium]|nr:MAG: hypothetical protein DME57_09420 [Verrucomicrobiota bacterium]
MKNFIIVVVAVGAIGYYFDISPTDFLPSVGNHSAATLERHASAGRAPAPAASAQPQPTAASTPTPNKVDGSLDNRWKP